MDTIMVSQTIKNDSNSSKRYSSKVLLIIFLSAALFLFAAIVLLSDQLGAGDDDYIKGQYEAASVQYVDDQSFLSFEATRMNLNDVEVNSIRGDLANKALEVPDSVYMVESSYSAKQQSKVTISPGQGEQKTIAIQIGSVSGNNGWKKVLGNTTSLSVIPDVKVSKGASLKLTVQGCTDASISYYESVDGGTSDYNNGPKSGPKSINKVSGNFDYIFKFPGNGKSVTTTNGIFEINEGSMTMTNTENGDKWCWILLNCSKSKSFSNISNASEIASSTWCLFKLIFSDSVESTGTFEFLQDSITASSAQYMSGDAISQELIEVNGTTIIQKSDASITVVVGGTKVYQTNRLVLRQFLEAHYMPESTENLTITWMGVNYTYSNGRFLNGDAQLDGITEENGVFSTINPVIMKSGDKTVFPYWVADTSDVVTIQFSKAYTVKGISSNASNVQNVGSLIIPDHVETIGAAAFRTVNLTDDGLITFRNPSVITTIGSDAFGNSKITMDLSQFTSLTTIAEGLFSVGDNITGSNSVYSTYPTDGTPYAVINTSNNTVLTILNTDVDLKALTSQYSLAPYAFKGFTGDLSWFPGLNVESLNGANVSSLIIPVGSCMNIESYQFYQMPAQKIKIEADISEIGTYAFAGSTMEELEIVTSGIQFNELSIMGCSSLKKVIISPNSNVGDGSVSVSIGTRAFYNDVRLTEFEFGPKVMIREIGDYAFAGVPLTKFGETEGSITIPSEVEKLGVASFSAGFGGVVTRMAEYMKNVNGLSIPAINAASTIKYDDSISSDVYATTTSGAKIKKSVSLVFESGNSLTDIPQGAFFGRIFTSIDLSQCSNLTSISPYAFYNAGGNIVWTDSITNIGYASFMNFLTGKTSFALPSNIESIDGFAFFTESPTDMTFTVSENSKLETLSDYSLPWTGSINAIDLTMCSHLRYVGQNDWKFSLPAGLIYLNLKGSQLSEPDKVILSADDGSLEISSEIQTLNLNAMNGPIQNISVIGNDHFVVSDGVLSYVIGSEKIFVKALSTVTAVDSSGFTEISDYAFVGCASIETISISSSVMKIGSEVFNDANSLKTIIITGNPEYNSDTFRGLPYGVTICADSSNEQYSVADHVALKDTSTSYLAYFEKSNDRTTMTVSDKQYANGQLSFSLSWSKGYTDADVDVVNAITGQIILPIDGRYSADSGCIIIFTIKDRSADSNVVRITFDPSGGSINGGTEHVLELPSGRSIIESDYVDLVLSKNESTFRYWSIDGKTEFDFDTVIKTDIKLFAVWSDRNPVLTVIDRYGIITASDSAGNIIESGDEIVRNSMITFTADLLPGYEDAYWVLDGSAISSQTGYVLADTPYKMSVTSDITITISAKTISQSGVGASLKQITSDGLPSADQLSKVVEVATISGNAVTDGMVWSGMSSVPLIVGDDIYLRFGKWLCKLETDTGYVTKKIESKDITAYYGYLTYGNGIILDNNNCKAYDTDLNLKFTFPEVITNQSYYNGISYNDGYFYFYNDYASGGKFQRFSSNTPDNSMATLEDVCDFGSGWKVWGAPVFKDNYAYMILVSLGKGDEQRSLAAVSLTGNHEKSQISLDSLISGNLLDDGWITYHDGVVYVTSYTSGLFSGQTVTDSSAIVGVSVTDLSFGTPVKMSLLDSTGAPLSFAVTDLVVFKERGYVVATNELLVLDMLELNKAVKQGQSPDFSKVKIYSEKTGFSHGGIVVETSYATRANDYTVYIYNIPYEINGGIYVHTDCQTKTTATEPTINYNIPDQVQYSSQAMRAGQNGEMVWYNDTGQTFIYTTPEKNVFFFFIQDGDVAQWYKSYGSSAAEALKSLGPSVVTLSSIKSLSTVYGDDADDWKIWALHSTSLGDYEWVELNNLYSVSYDVDHYYVISRTLPNGQSSYQYLNADGQMSTYTFKDNIGDRSIVGVRLIAGASSDVSFVEFKDGQSTVSKVIGKIGDSVDVGFPQVYKFGYVAHWVKTEDITSTNLTEKYVTSTSGAKFVDGGTSYSVLWEKMVSHYALDAELEKGSSNTKVVVSIARDYGAEDPSDLVIYIIAHYNDGRFISISTDAALSTGIGKRIATVSSMGLESVMVQLIKGYPDEGIPSYYSEECLAHIAE